MVTFPSKHLSSQIQKIESSLFLKGTQNSAIRGRLNFDSPRKRRNSALDQDPLTGLERYPKAIKSEDTMNMQAEVQRLKMQLIQKGLYFLFM